MINSGKLEIDFQSPIGNGTFSEVYKGVLYGIYLYHYAKYTGANTYIFTSFSLIIFF